MPVPIHLPRLLRYCHPLRSRPWGVLVTPRDVREALASGRMRREPSIMACVSGDLHYAHELFGIDCEEEDLCPHF